MFWNVDSILDIRGSPRLGVCSSLHTLFYLHTMSANHMLNFNYENPTRIVFGKGQIAELPNLIPKDKKILLCYGGGSIKRNGVYDQCMAALAGYEVTEFGGIEANPDYETLLKAINILRENGADQYYVLAVGGGSVADGCKLICAAAVYDKSTDYYQDLCIEGGAKCERALPLGVVLTLPATGSESNGNAVISYRAKHMKYIFFSTLTYPKFAIMDPETTMSLPDRQTINGVVDSFVHVCEQYVTDCRNADVQDRYSESLMKVLVENGLKVKKDPKDYDARANIMWAANQALNCWIAQGVRQDWATHMVGHEITAYTGMDHGATLAIVQPKVFHFNFEHKFEKLAQLGERVFGIVDADKRKAAEMTIDRICKFYYEEMGIASSINQYFGKEYDKAWVEECYAKLNAANVHFGEDANIDAAVTRDILYKSFYFCLLEIQPSVSLE